MAEAVGQDFHCELAWLGGDGATGDVLIQTAAGRITAVSPGASLASGAARLPGLTMPGLVNSHSHVFHRAIRGRTQSGVADFWQWRRLMYDVAARLDPDRMYGLARATYAEMALSGVTSVGEFHYLHHGSGSRYDAPNVMADAVISAANDVGIRITLLDTCYLQADVRGTPLSGVQERFGDGSWHAWVERVDELAASMLRTRGTDQAANGSIPSAGVAGLPRDMARVGAAIHSVRAVPRQAMAPVAEYARSRDLPLHVHVSEQPAENAAAREAFGLSPTELLASEGVLGPTTTAVHATHVTAEDIALLGGSATTVSMCCTTERDLADGVGPAVRLSRAGSPLCVGSDSHATIDLWEEARAVELDERLISGRRGHLRVDQLARALTDSGARSIGMPGGRLVPGALADLVTVRLDSPRTAGARSGDALAHVLYAATAADVSTVVVGGRVVVDDGRHTIVEDVGRSLEIAIAARFADEAPRHRAGSAGEDPRVLGERLELERVAGGVEQEHRPLLARLAREAHVRLDDERDVGSSQPLGERVEVGHRQDQPEVGDRHVVAVDRVGGPPGRARGQMGHELVPAEVPVDPGVTGTPLRAAEDLTVEGHGSGQIVDGDGEVEARQPVGGPGHQCS